MGTKLDPDSEQIVKRLKEERIGFDNQLAAIERTLKAKACVGREQNVRSAYFAHLAC